MTPKTPPAAWDRHALEVARGIASLDRAKIPPAQFVSIIQAALVDAMRMAREETDLQWATELRKCVKPETGIPHQWDGEGERCTVCGDKDWFAGPTCNGRVSKDGGKTRPLSAESVAHKGSDSAGIGQQENAPC